MWPASECKKRLKIASWPDVFRRTFHGSGSLKTWCIKHCYHRRTRQGTGRGEEGGNSPHKILENRENLGKYMLGNKKKRKFGPIYQKICYIQAISLPSSWCIKNRANFQLPPGKRQPRTPIIALQYNYSSITVLDYRNALCRIFALLVSDSVRVCPADYFQAWKLRSYS